MQVAQDRMRVASHTANTNYYQQLFRGIDGL